MGKKLEMVTLKYLFYLVRLTNSWLVHRNIACVQTPLPLRKNQSVHRLPQQPVVPLHGPIPVPPPHKIHQHTGDYILFSL